MADVKYIITADAKGAVTEIKKVEGAIGGMKTQASQAKSPISGMWKQIAVGVGVAGLAAGATRALGNAVRGMVRFMGDSITKAGEQEKVLKQLETVLASTGGAAGLTKKELVEMASGLQDVTTFGDEAILQGQNLLLTFTNIGRDVFPQATETMLDMSVALGQDMKSSAIQLGKALNDPILGVTALRRVGVNFSQAQADMIKKMVESGDVMGAQKFILQELQTEFGGTARAAGETFPGQLQSLDNAFGDLKETIGGTITENQSLREGISDLKGKIKELSESEDFKLWLDVVIGGFIDAVELVGKFAAGVKDLTEKVFKLDKKDRELAEAQEKLNASLERAKEAGHDLAGKYKVVAEETEETKDKHKALTETISTTKTKIESLDASLLKITGDFVAGKYTVSEYHQAIEDLKDGTARFKAYLDTFDLSEMEGEIESALAVIESEGSAIGSVFDDIGVHIFDAQGNLVDFGETSETVSQETESIWSETADGLKTKWSSMFGDWVKSGDIFKGDFKGLMDGILSIASDTFGQMASKFMTMFIDEIIGGSADAGKEIAKNIGSAVGGEGSGSIAEGFSKVSGAVGGLASGLTAVSSVVSAIANVASLFKKSGPSSTDSWHFEHIWINTKEARDWLFNNAQARLDEMTKALTGILPEKMAATRKIVRDIKEILKGSQGILRQINKSLGGSISAPGGLDTIMRQTTPVITHSGERVIVQTPSQQLQANVNVRMGAAPIHLELDGRQIAMAVAKYTPELTKLGHMKIHKNSFIEN